MNDYYQILQLKHRFSSLNLLHNYFKMIKLSLEANDHEEIIKARMGFEVLRHEDSKISYDRIHRKYILNQELNFPKVRESEMTNLVKSKEQLGMQEANKIIHNKDSFIMFLIHYFIGFILTDILYSLFGVGGILYIIIGLLILISSIHGPFIVGILTLLFGFVLLNRSFKGYIHS